MFTSYHTTCIKNPLKSKQAVIAVACKLTQVSNVILTKGTTHDDLARTMGTFAQKIFQEDFRYENMGGSIQQMRHATTSSKNGLRIMRASASAI